MNGITPSAVRPADRRDLRLAADPDRRRRHRHLHPLHLAAAGVPRASKRRMIVLSGGGAKALRTAPTDDDHAGPATSHDAARVRGLPGQRRHLGKGHGTAGAALVRQIEAGAVGFKCHEDWGTTPAAVLRSALTVADEMDVQVCIHTDTLNESGFVEDTIDAFEGRNDPLVPHRGGSGGGHAPTSSASRRCPTCCRRRPTRRCPYGINSQAELYDMIMVCHHLEPGLPVRTWPSPRAGSRRDHRRRERAAGHRRDLDDLERLAGDGPHRRELAAHDPDGRRDEDRRGKLPEDAKSATTTSASCATRVAKDHHQPGDHARHLARARLGRGRQDRRPGALVGARLLRRQTQAGDQGRRDHWGDGRPNASLPTPQPVLLPSRCSARSAAVVQDACITFVSGAAQAAGVQRRLGLRKRQVMPVKNTRRISKRA